MKHETHEERWARINRSFSDPSCETVCEWGWQDYALLALASIAYVGLLVSGLFH